MQVTKSNVSASEVKYTTSERSPLVPRGLRCTHGTVVWCTHIIDISTGRRFFKRQGALPWIMIFRTFREILLF